MKKSIKGLFLLIVVLMLSSVPFVQADSLDDGTEIYTLVVENVCAEPVRSGTGTASAFSLDTYSGSYGDQLSGTAKEIYDTMVKHYVTDKKTDDCVCTFKTPFTFEAEVFMGTVMTNTELSDIKFAINCAMQMAQDAFLYDHPELFWLRIFASSYTISTKGNSSSGYTGSISSVNVTPYEVYLGASDNISEYNAAVDRVLSSINIEDSTYETLRNIHDYICDNAWYYSLGSKTIYTSEPFFIGNGGVVCEGYSEAFKVLCDRLEIPCALIVGDAGGPHMWNYVQMDDGKWYLVDVTWDDGDDGISYTYFIANANTVGFENTAIRNERTPDGDFSETGIMTFTYPELAESEYATVHIHQWGKNYTVDKAPSCTEKGSKSIHCDSCGAKKSVTEIPATNHAGKTEFPQQSATCTQKGYTAGVYCPDCRKWLSGHKETDYAPHQYKTTVTMATLKADGKQTQRCSVCSGIRVIEIYRPETIALSKTSYTYDGKVKTPTVTVKDSQGNVLKQDTDYTLSYENGRKATGRYTVTVTFKGKYSGAKKLYFTISPETPGKVSAVQSTKAIKLTWSKVNVADGYRVYQYNAKSKKWDSIKTLKTASYKVENLKAGTVYKFRIKAYKKDDGTIWGKATDTISVATKPVAPENIRTVQSAKAIKLSWSKVTGADGYRVYQYNSKTKAWDKIKTLTGTSYKIQNLKSGTIYKFRIKAYKVLNGETLWSSATSTITAATKPATPIITTVASTSKGRATVSWTNVAGETGYELWASTKKDSGYKKVVTTKADVTKGGRTDFVSGRTYYFKVRAYKTVDDARIYSSWSAVKSVKVK